MKDQLQSKLVEILSSAQSVSTDAYEFVKAQAPQLAEEVVRWRLVEEWMALTLLLGFMLAAVAASIVGQFKISKIENEPGPLRGEWHPARMLHIVTAFVLLMASGPAYSSVKLIIQAKVAPRVFFINACSDLLR